MSTDTPRTDTAARHIDGFADKWVPRYVSEELKRDLADMTEQRDRLAEEITQLKSQLTQTRGAVTISRNGYVQELEQQRDRLAEALERILSYQGRFAEEDPESIATEALQSLTPNAKP